MSKPGCVEPGQVWLLERVKDHPDGQLLSAPELCGVYLVCNLDGKAWPGEVRGIVLWEPIPSAPDEDVNDGCLTIASPDELLHVGTHIHADTTYAWRTVL